MSTTAELPTYDGPGFDHIPPLTLQLDLEEAEALRAWLLKPAADGTTSLDDELVSRVLADLGRAIDTKQAILGIRRELEAAGLDVKRLSDEQVLDLGSRVAQATAAVARD